MASRTLLGVRCRVCAWVWAITLACGPNVLDLGPLPNPTIAAPTGESSTLKLATWNLNWLNATEAAGLVPRSAADYARLGDYARELDADVIAVQEVDGVAALARVFDPAVYDLYVPLGSNVQRTGFAFRWELGAVANPDFTELEVGGLRAGSDVTIEIGGVELRLLSVHLKSGCFEEPLGTGSDDCAKLAAQVPLLESWIDERALEGSGFAVLGDFNRRLFKGADEVWSELDDADPRESDLTSPTAGRAAECWGGAFPDFIDHLVLSKSLGERLVSGSFSEQDYLADDWERRAALSDHCPLSVSIDLR